MAQFDISL